MVCTYWTETSSCSPCPKVLSGEIPRPSHELPCNRRSNDQFIGELDDPAPAATGERAIAQDTTAVTRCWSAALFFSVGVVKNRVGFVAQHGRPCCSEAVETNAPLRLFPRHRVLFDRRRRTGIQRWFVRSSLYLEWRRHLVRGQPSPHPSVQRPSLQWTSK